MGKPSLLWQVILAVLNLLVFLGIIQVWWNDSDMPKQGPSQKTERVQIGTPPPGLEVEIGISNCRDQKSFQFPASRHGKKRG